MTYDILTLKKASRATGMSHGTRDSLMRLHSGQQSGTGPLADSTHFDLRLWLEQGLGCLKHAFSFRGRAKGQTGYLHQ